MKTYRVSKEEMEKLRKMVRELSDDELDKAAGGIGIPVPPNGQNNDLWCEPGCEPILNGCYCEDW